MWNLLIRASKVVSSALKLTFDLEKYIYEWFEGFHPVFQGGAMCGAVKDLQAGVLLPFLQLGQTGY